MARCLCPQWREAARPGAAKAYPLSTRESGIGDKTLTVTPVMPHRVGGTTRCLRFPAQRLGSP